MANYVNDVMVITQSSASTPEQPQYEVTMAQSAWVNEKVVSGLITEPVQLVVGNADWRLIDPLDELGLTIESEATYSPENGEFFLLKVHGKTGDIRSIERFITDDAGCLVQMPFERLILEWTQPAASLFQSARMIITDCDIHHGITVDTETGEVSL